MNAQSIAKRMIVFFELIGVALVLYAWHAYEDGLAFGKVFQDQMWGFAGVVLGSALIVAVYRDGSLDKDDPAESQTRRRLLIFGGF